MRSARVVGLSPDGMTLVVATDSGEELAIAADDQLRAAVRGDRPRLGQLEIEMETSLSPRDIQTRIRAGATLDDVARVAGLPMDRVERFAAPVLAERDHVAITAMSASVRRRGETSGHRNLRITVTERLTTRGVDIEAIEWDAYRLEDGRWSVTASYSTGDEDTQAEFLYDPRGRFSVANNDRARWLLGEHPSAGAAQPGQRDDTEPTVDLNDELALVRATQEVEPSEQDLRDEAAEPTIAVVRTLIPVPDAPAQEAGTDDEGADDEGADEGSAPDSTKAGTELSVPGVDVTALRVREVVVSEVIVTEVAVTEVGVTEVAMTEVAVTEVAVTEGAATEGAATGQDAPSGAQDAVAKLTGHPETGHSYATLSDATAVPETSNSGWEPAIVVNFPLEPSSAEDGTDEPGPPDPIVDGPGRADEVREFELESEVDAPAVRKPAKKKRASVPTWDEIMFGGPRPPTS